MDAAPLDNVKAGTERAVRQAKPWLHGLARFGYMTKGVIYLIMGALAFRTALGIGEKTTDTRGALVVIQREPFGKALLMGVVVGLVGYVVWRFIQAFLDPEGKGWTLSGTLSRLGYLASGCGYALLAYTSVKLIQGVDERRNVTQHWTAHFLHVPFGQWVVAAAGAVVIAVGLYGVVVGVTARFREHMELGRIGGGGGRWLTWMGTLGYASRGIVFIIVGLFLMQAGIHADPNTARGMDGAQNMLGHWSDSALYVIAVGLIAFGAFMFVEAKYNRIAVR